MTTLRAPFDAPQAIIETGACQQYTSDRDPRVCVRANVPTGSGSGYISSYHTFWSLEDAQIFADRVRNARPMQGGYQLLDGLANASAERLTTAEVAWLCTPLAETPADWMVQPAALKGGH